MFIDGFLGLTMPGGADFTSAGYARQPISFGEPINGVTFNANAYSFGMTIKGYAGRAIYDAPSGGNLLLTLPLATPARPGRLPWDAGDAVTLRLVFAALIPYRKGAAYSGTIMAAGIAGTCNDQYDIVNPAGLVADIGNPTAIINTGVMTAGVGLTLTRGVLRASSVPA